jgi:hypothetical protein
MHQPDPAEPLIHTTMGNVPVASLQYFAGWEEDERAITFIQEYRLQDGATVVRRDVHVRVKQGAQADGRQAVL